jgi:hypothetical protein
MEPIIDPDDMWLLVPAPPELKEPAYSFDSYRIPLYPPDEIAAAILSAPGMRIERPPRTWEDWKARWEQAGRYIEVEINAMEAESDVGTVLAWESSPIRVRCRPSEFLAVWESIRSRCGGVWLADENDRLWSPRSFGERLRVETAPQWTRTEANDGNGES